MVIEKTGTNKKRKSETESGKRIAEVSYFDKTRSFIIRMSNGKIYQMQIFNLPEADSSRITGWSIGEERNYIWVAQESGNRFEIPWDYILYHCEPEYEYYRRKKEPDSDDNIRQIGKRIRDLREARVLTVSDLATKAGMKRPNLSRLEHGRHQPSLETLERIAGALEISVAEMIARKPVEHFIACRKQKTALKKGFGAWKDSEHTDMATPEDSATYVSAIRERNSGRLARVRDVDAK